MPSSLRACTVWFTGLSGRGKNMIIDELVPQLKSRQCKIEILDEEVVRADVNWDFVLARGVCEHNLQWQAVICHQLQPSGAFTVIAGASEEPPDDSEIICDVDKEPPSECASKVMQKLSQMGCWAPFGLSVDEDDVYSADEETMLTQRLEDLGYV